MFRSYIIFLDNAISLMIIIYHKYQSHITTNKICIVIGIYWFTLIHSTMIKTDKTSADIWKCLKKNSQLVFSEASFTMTTPTAIGLLRLSPVNVALTLNIKPSIYVFCEHIYTALLPCSGVKRMLFLALLAVKRMVMWTTRMGGISSGWRSELIGKRLLSADFNKSWVKAASLVRVNLASFKFIF